MDPLLQWIFLVVKMDPFSQRCENGPSLKIGLENKSNVEMYKSHCGNGYVSRCAVDMPNGGYANGIFSFYIKRFVYDQVFLEENKRFQLVFVVVFVGAVLN